MRFPEGGWNPPPPSALEEIWTQWQIGLSDRDSSNDFADVSDPLIQEYHGLSPKAIHTSHMVMVKTQANREIMVYEKVTNLEPRLLNLVTKMIKR